MFRSVRIVFCFVSRRVSADGDFDAQLAMVAEPYVRGVGVFGEDYRHLADLDVQEALGGVAEERNVVFFAVRGALVLECGRRRPSHRLGAFQRYVDVDVFAVCLKPGFLTRKECRFLALDGDVGAVGTLPDGAYTGNKLVRLMVHEPFDGGPQGRRDGAVSRAVLFNVP